MIDRVEIATRHGLAPEIGPSLHGETRAELEADAAARAAVAQLVGGKLNPIESKPTPTLADLSDEELTEQAESIQAERQRREQEAGDNGFVEWLLGPKPSVADLVSDADEEG